MRLTACFLIVGLLTGGAGAGTRAQQLPPPDYTFPTIIVTATRTPTPVDEIGSAVSVIEGADLRARGATTLLESLSFLPGLALSRAGEAAGTGGVYLRGGKAEHLLVLVDGIAVNDPIAPGGSFDWSTLPADAPSNGSRLSGGLRAPCTGRRPSRELSTSSPGIPPPDSLPDCHWRRAVSIP